MPSGLWAPSSIVVGCVSTISKRPGMVIDGGGAADGVVVELRRRNACAAAIASAKLRRW